MCSCANECVHVGPISTFDLNNSNSGVAQISNRACLWSRLQSGLKLLVIDYTDHMYLPAPSFSMCFSYSAGWDEMNRKLAVVILSVGWKHVLKPKWLAFRNISWIFRLACWWPRWRRSPRSSGSRSSPSSSSTSATRCVCPCRWPLTLWPLRNLFSRKTSSSGTVLPTRGCEQGTKSLALWSRFRSLWDHRVPRQPPNWVKHQENWGQGRWKPTKFNLYVQIKEKHKNVYNDINWNVIQ